MLKCPQFQKPPAVPMSFLSKSWWPILEIEIALLTFIRPHKYLSIGEAGQSRMQHFPISKDVTETQDKAVWFSGPRLAPLVKHPTPDLSSGPDLRGREF